MEALFVAVDSAFDPWLTAAAVLAELADDPEFDGLLAAVLAETRLPWIHRARLAYASRVLGTSAPGLATLAQDPRLDDQQRIASLQLLVLAGDPRTAARVARSWPGTLGARAWDAIATVDARTIAADLAAGWLSLPEQPTRIRALVDFLALDLALPQRAALALRDRERDHRLSRPDRQRARVALLRLRVTTGLPLVIRQVEKVVGRTVALTDRVGEAIMNRIG